MTTDPVSTSTPSTPVAAAAAAPASPVSLGSDPQPRPKGRQTAFHRSSYTALPGSPVTADTRPEDLEFPRESRAYALFFYTLCFIASRSAHGADIVALPVPEIASMARHSRRWVYKALNYLSYHGFVFLIPTPAYVVGGKLDRVVCLRVPSPGSRPVAPYVDPDARPISSADALWLGKPNPTQPRDPAPHLVPLATVKVPSRAVLAKATRRAKAVACPDLSILDAVPPNDEAAFCRVVTKAVAERFGTVRTIPVARARLPVPHRIFDPDFELEDDVNCPGPYTIERAADSGGRRSFVRQLGNGKQKRDPYGHVKRDPRGWRVNTSILLRRSEAGHGSPTAGNPPSPPPPIRTASRRFRPDAGAPWRPVRRRGRPGRPRPGRAARPIAAA